MVKRKLMDTFKAVLRKEGFKITPQRIAVIEEIVKGKGHRESEEIYLEIKSYNTHVSRATVYRTLDILVKNNFVRKLNLGDGRARYESKIDGYHHDHLVCEKCGQIFEFIDYEIEKRQEEIAKKHQFIMTRHTHQLFGICRECQ